MPGHWHDPFAGTQNQGNHIGNRACVRQSKLYRMHESGNAIKELMGQASLQWDTDQKEGAYAGQKVYDHETADHSALLRTHAERPSLQIASTPQFGVVAAAILPVAPEPVLQSPEPATGVEFAGSQRRRAGEEEEDYFWRSQSSMEKVAPQRGHGRASIRSHVWQQRSNEQAGKQLRQQPVDDSSSVTSPGYHSTPYSRRSGAPPSLNKELGEDYFWRNKDDRNARNDKDNAYSSNIWNRDNRDSRDRRDSPAESDYFWRNREPRDNSSSSYKPSQEPTHIFPPVTPSKNTNHTTDNQDPRGNGAETTDYFWRNRDAREHNHKRNTNLRDSNRAHAPLSFDRRGATATTPADHVWQDSTPFGHSSLASAIDSPSFAYAATPRALRAVNLPPSSPPQTDRSDSRDGLPTRRSLPIFGLDRVRGLDRLDHHTSDTTRVQPSDAHHVRDRAPRSSIAASVLSTRPWWW